MTYTESSHARTLSLSHHLLQLLEASTSAPVNRTTLTHLLRDDPALLANFLDTLQHSDLVTPVGGNDWLHSLVAQLEDSDLQRFAISCVQPWLTLQLEDSHWLMLRTLFSQSRKVAELARQLATQTDGVDAIEAALAGSVHNIGRLMFFSQSPSRFIDSPAAAAPEPRILEEEQRLWGTDHQRAASRRIRQWPLDSYLCDAVELLYKPADLYPNSTALVRVLYVAEQLNRTDQPGKAVIGHARTLLGIDDATLRQCLADARSRCEELSWLKLDDDAFCARQREAVSDLRSALGSLALRQVSHLELARAQGLSAVVARAQTQLSPYFQRTALFLVSGDRRQLHGFPVPGQPQRLADMQAPLQPGDNLVAHALLENETADSLDAEAFALSMLDRQLQLLLGGDSFCCLPLSFGSARLGVLVVRIDSTDQRALVDNNQVRGIVANLAQLLHAQQRSADAPAREEPGRLVREIYHELSNPISAVRNHLYMLKRKSGDDSRPVLEHIEKEVGRIADLIAQYRQRSQNLEQASHEVDINRIVRESVSRSVEQADQNRTVEMQLDDGLPGMTVNQLALEQILTNLVGNAIEATSNEDTITVASHGNWQVGDTRYVEISVSDTGPGLPERVRQALFSPVASSKGGNHSGLGLSIVKNLADEMNALVHCHSDRSGTRFQLLIPCSGTHNNNKEAFTHAATHSE